MATPSLRAIKTREGLARASAIVLIVVMGLGLTTVYGELLEERASGRERTELLQQLESDNDALRRDNDSLRVLIQKQNELLKELALHPSTVTVERIREVTQLPPELFPPKPNENGEGTGGKPKPTPTVKPEPKPTPTPTPTANLLIGCVPVLNLCL